MNRSALTRRVAIFSLVILAFVATVTTLNVTLYSATGFVSSYLQALARHDVDAALAMKGVAVPGGASRALLAPTALARLGNIQLISDVDAGGGAHTVTYGYTIGGVAGRTAFEVSHTEPRFGVFSAWEFSQTPISVLQVTPQNSDAFTANGLSLTSASEAGQPVALYVLTPAAITLGHRSTYFTAATVHAVVEKTGTIMPAVVDVEANKDFITEVQKELDANLASCVKQKVLLPTGCPMGTQITDRIQDAPTWTMAKYPSITIVPASAPGTWQVPSTKGVAHLTVQVKSIFDGTVSTFSKDVPFTVKYAISFPHGVLTIAAQY